MQWQPLTGRIGERVKPDPIPEYQPGPLVSYRRQWLLVILLAVSALYYHLHNPGIPFQPVRTVPAAGAELGDWFFLLHLPEAPEDAAAQGLYKDRLHNWLFALHEAGFQPLRLSEALNALAQGKPLPARSVVLMVDPGMRRTYECLDPMLVRGRWPSVWLTDGEVLKNPDTTYLSPHQLSIMKTAGPWELAYYQAAKDSFLMDPDSQSADGSPWKDTLGWKANAGRQALNRGTPQGALNRLNLNLAWTSGVLVDTLLTEMPARKAALLTIKPAHHRMLGMAVELPAPMPIPPFHLEAEPDSRHAVVGWPGTRGIQDLVLDLNVASRIGEIWVLLRSDLERGENVRVGFKDGAVFLEFDQFPSKTRLARWPMPSLLRGPLRASMTLHDQLVTLHVNGRDFPPVTLPSRLVSHEGTVQFYIQDKVQGAAQATGVGLTLTVLDAPLDHTALTPP